METDLPQSTNVSKASHSQHGFDLLNDPFLNKGTAFTEEERDALGIRGLLPPRVIDLHTQIDRVMENIRKKPNDLERYIFLTLLEDRNKTLFYKVITEHMNELMPIIYTPTVGEACEKYGHIYRNPKGLFISIRDKGKIRDIIANWPYDDIRVIVVTDGERILGLGDQGANGMGIPVGKLALYTACAGIPPEKCLPITLDLGTNNEELLRDPMYIGITEHRIRGAEYDEFIDEFMYAVVDRYPKVLIQLEDFANVNAFRLLEKHRRGFCVFDDDIQGTGSVALAGIIASERINGIPVPDHKFLILGSGEAGIGIANQIVCATVARGMEKEEARRRCWFTDSKGLVVKSRNDLNEQKLIYAQDHPESNDLVEIVNSIQPTGIIAVTGIPGLISRKVAQAISQLSERPLLFALSNPTSKSECTARQAYEWTHGRAIFASGSPFRAVDCQGKTFVPGQANNAYIFPGVGLGILAAEASHVVDEMFLAAAEALAENVTDQDLALGRIYPSLRRIREVSVDIATAVANIAYDHGIARRPRPEDLPAYIRSLMFEPEYQTVG